MKKKIVLICFYDRINLSIRTLSSVLKSDGHDVSLIFFKDDRTAIIDEFQSDTVNYQYVYNGNFIGCSADVNPATDLEYDILMQKIMEIRPDIIGVSARTPLFDVSRNIADRLRKKLPESVYIAGGYGPSLEPEKFLAHFDFVCVGEGERFVREYAKSMDPDLTPNLARRVNGDIIYNDLAEPEDLSRALFPDWDPENKYAIEDNMIKPLCDTYDRQTYDIFVSRGCPSSCTYCMASHWNTLYKNYGARCPRVRLRSPESAISELLDAKRKYDIGYVRFMDSIFGYNEKWLFEFLDSYDREIGLDFFCHLDSRFTNKAVLERLKVSGLKTTTIGIQSLDPDIRRRVMGRNITNEQIIDYAWTVHDLEFKFQYDIIHWNPFDTEESLENAVPFVRMLPKGVQIVLFHLVFFPGSKIYQLFKKEKPLRLNASVYEFWAWIYILILRGGEFEDLANFFLKHRATRNYPRLLQELYHEVIQSSAGTQLITARRDLKKGEHINTVMLDYIESHQANGIPYEERLRLVDFVPKRDIVKGEILRWEDLYSSYGYK